MSDIGNNIKRARLEKGISQEALAQAIGTTKSTISKYELGRREPRLDTLRKISHILEVDLEVILGPENIIPASALSKKTHLPEALIMDILSTDDPSYKEAKDYLSFVGSYLLQSGDEHQITASVIECIANSLTKLNISGQQKAAERVEELTEIPKYRRDTETPPEAPDGPPEAK